jgi:hypothetical protein
MEIGPFAYYKWNKITIFLNFCEFSYVTFWPKLIQLFTSSQNIFPNYSNDIQKCMKKATPKLAGHFGEHTTDWADIRLGQTIPNN